MGSAPLPSSARSMTAPRELGGRGGGFVEHSKGGVLMRYLVAWLLGVPGAVILVWFLFAHLH